MAKQKKPVHRVEMTEGKRNIIRQLLEEYDIETAEDNTKVQTTCGYSLEGTFYPEDGQYIVLTVTNNGSAAQTVTAGRALTLGGFEKFTSVDIGAGETLTRAFLIADGAEELESTLAFGVYAKGVSSLSDITVSLKQYK